MIKINLNQIGDIMTIEIPPSTVPYGESKVPDFPNEEGYSVASTYSYNIPWSVLKKDEQKGCDERICNICKCTIL